MTQQVQELRDDLEVTQYKANDEVGNLNSLLNVDYVKKETLYNRVETLENIAVGIEHEYSEATEELAVILVVEHLISYYVLLYLPNVCFNFALALTYKACQYPCHTKSKKCGVVLQWDKWMT